MGKFITRKPSKSTPDFQKKTKKVGKTSKPLNATKIDVKAKTIIIPSQSLHKHFADEKKNIEQQVKLLKHHSTSARTGALSQLKGYLADSMIPSQFVPTIIPPIMETILDEEKSVRDGLLNLLGPLCLNHPNALRTCASIVLAFVRSGLSSLNRVRYLII